MCHYTQQRRLPLGVSGKGSSQQCVDALHMKKWTSSAAASWLRQCSSIYGGDAGKWEARQGNINKHLICSYVPLPLKWWKERAGRKDRIMELVCLWRAQRRRLLVWLKCSCNCWMCCRMYCNDCGLFLSSIFQLPAKHSQQAQMYFVWC